MPPDPTRTVTAPPADTSTQTGIDLPTASGDAVRAIENLTHTRADAAVAPAPLDAPPGFVVEKELGEGGMGVVYQARQVGLNRPVALKLVKGNARVDTKALIRFLAEAEVVAAVRHPNVVEVYQYGDHRGTPYLALEYCPGGDLTRLTKSEQTRDANWFRKVAELMARVADGVQAAHALGIVHRDLKPHNVLLAADGTPKVADFGLAKRGLGSDLTKTDAVMGTPAYMAPEQAGGGMKFVGPEADVWALGVMLYELCCGRRPIDASGPVLEALARVATAQMPALRTVCPAAPKDLALIAHKCLSKDPRDRYPTAGGLAADLRHWLDGRPISARPAGIAERVVRWVRRKPTSAAALGSSVLAVVLALVAFVVFGFWREAEAASKNLESANTALAKEKKLTEDARDGEAAAKKEVERQRETLARIEYGRTIQLAYQAWRDNRIAYARALLAGTRSDLRGWEYDYVHRVCHADSMTFTGYTDEVNSTSWSPDGSKVVTLHAGSATVWDVTTGAVAQEFRKEKQYVNKAVWGPVGLQFATKSDKSTTLWDAATGTRSLELDYFPVGFSADGSRSLAKEGVPDFRNDTVTVRDTKSGTLISQHKEHVAVSAPALGFRASARSSLSADGTKVVSAASEKTAIIWDAGTGKDVAELKGHTKRILFAAFSPDGNAVVTTSEDQTARVWDATTGKLVNEFQGHSAPVLHASFHQTGRYLVTASEDFTARLWDVATGRLVKQLLGHTSHVTEAVFHPSEFRVVTASRDKTVRLWDVGGKFTPELADPLRAFSMEATSADGSKFLSMNRMGDVGLIASRGKQAPIELRGHKPRILAGAFSLDGTMAATAGMDRSARVWDTATGKQLHLFEGHGEEVRCVAFSPNGKQLATGSSDTTARVWDIVSGLPLGELRGHTDAIIRVTWTPNGSRVITNGLDRTIRVWEPNTGAELLVLPGLIELGFAPDGSGILAEESGGRQRYSLIYDSRPVNRVFSRAPKAPAER